MLAKELTFHGMSPFRLTVRYLDITADSPINQHESHIHEECEIYLNLSGDITFEVEDSMYPISRGCLILTQPYEYHHVIYHSDRPHRHYWITFSCDGTQEFLKIFYDRKKGRNNLRILDEEKLKTVCGQLDRLLHEDSDSLTRMIVFLQLMQLLQSDGTALTPEHGNNMPQDVMIALRYMDEHLTEELDIKAIAAFCCTSVNTLERHFSEVLGTSPFRMLRQKRLLRSVLHLRNGCSVTEAAMKSGFPDCSNYIQLFRKTFGMTPLQYKKRIGGI